MGYTFNPFTGNFDSTGAPGGSGTVTSVAMTAPAIFSVSGSPVTTAGTLALTLATQAKNLVWAGPSSGSNAAPTFRALVGADLPLPAAATLGGVFSIAPVSHQFLTGISSVDGSISKSQPAFTDISGTIASTQLPSPTGSTKGALTTGTVAGMTLVSDGSGGIDTAASFMRNPNQTNTFIYSDATRAEFSMDNIAKWGATGSSVFLSTGDWNTGTALMSMDTGVKNLGLFGDVNWPFYNFVNPGAHTYNVAPTASTTVYLFRVDRNDALVTFRVTLQAETADALEYLFMDRIFRFWGNGTIWAPVPNSSGVTVGSDTTGNATANHLGASTLVATVGGVSGWDLSIVFTNAHSTKTAGVIVSVTDFNAHPSY